MDFPAAGWREPGYERGMDKHVMITGCTRGLGLAMARAFAARGWRVSGCGTKPGGVARLVEELDSIGGGHIIRPCDVTRGEDVEAMAGEILATAGPPDLLVNNAALINANAPLWEVPPEEFSKVIDVNLKGIHLVLRAFLPAMIGRGCGVVVNFSSGWGRSVSPEVATYCCTKWGVEGLTKALALELPDGMASVALNPGVIDTDMLRSAFGPASADHPGPASWAERAVPFLESLGPGDNGGSLSVN